MDSPLQATAWARLCRLEDLDPDVPRGFVLDDLAICVVRTGEAVFAVHDECTHAAVPLSEGEVED